MIPDPPSHSKCTEKRYPLYPTSSRIELRNASQTLFFAAFTSLFFLYFFNRTKHNWQKTACKRRNFIQAMSTFILVKAQNREGNYFIGISACPWLELFLHLFFFIFYSIRCFGFSIVSRGHLCTSFDLGFGFVSFHSKLHLLCHASLFNPGLIEH